MSEVDKLRKEIQKLKEESLDIHEICREAIDIVMTCDNENIKSLETNERLIHLCTLHEPLTRLFKVIYNINIPKEEGNATNDYI